MGGELFGPPAHTRPGLPAPFMQQVALFLQPREMAAWTQTLSQTIFDLTLTFPFLTLPTLLPPRESRGTLLGGRGKATEQCLA